MEIMVIDRHFWRHRRVFLTGHTGFKGAWLTLLLRRLGADVYGFALSPEDERWLFVTAGVEGDVHHAIGTICDLDAVKAAMSAARPEIAIHMAAQSLVRRSYTEPVNTYATNVLGTVNILEAVRHAPSVRATIVVTSDKCYENVGATRGYKETDTLGGRDPYSNSKACAELVTDAYRRSFFSAAENCAVASCRAGNVIGGGDWACDRLVPDAMRAFLAGHVLQIRNPDAVRPWQHVFDPLMAYLRLAEHLVQSGQVFAESWNFGPAPDSEVPVAKVVEIICGLWGADARWQVDDSGSHPHEAQYLSLDCSKARSRLAWRPLFDLEQSLRLTHAWYHAMKDGKDVRGTSLGQVDALLERYAPAVAR